MFKQVRSSLNVVAKYVSSFIENDESTIISELEDILNKLSLMTSTEKNKILKQLTYMKKFNISKDTFRIVNEIIPKMISLSMYRHAYILLQKIKVSKFNQYFDNINTLKTRVKTSKMSTISEHERVYTPTSRKLSKSGSVYITPVKGRKTIKNVNTLVAVSRLSETAKSTMDKMAIDMLRIGSFKTTNDESVLLGKKINKLYELYNQNPTVKDSLKYTIFNATGDVNVYRVIKLVFGLEMDDSEISKKLKSREITDIYQVFYLSNSFRNLLQLLESINKNHTSISKELIINISRELNNSIHPRRNIEFIKKTYMSKLVFPEVNVSDLNSNYIFNKFKNVNENPEIYDKLLQILHSIKNFLKLDWSEQDPHDKIFERKLSVIKSTRSIKIFDLD